jgi:transcriptional regulator with XRE-family HTH domain
MNQGEFADSVGVSRGAMSYYEQESRTPDIAVLRSICEKYNVSADYLLGLIEDENHAVSDACKVTGLSPEAVKTLNTFVRIVNETNASSNLFDDTPADAKRLGAFSSVAELLNILLENDDGLQLLTLLSAIVIGVDERFNQDKPMIVLKSASKFATMFPINDLTPALWGNIHQHAHELKKINAQAEKTKQEK